ncbi:hypothetical protein CR513_21484, partial [Mucuna pruriens]
MVAAMLILQAQAITKQVSLAFIVDKYEEEVLCHVVPMEATHILLGKPWQYECKVTYDGVTPKPLSPKEDVASKATMHPKDSNFKQMLESFQDFYRKYIKWGLPPLRGIEYRIDFIMGTTLPNRATHKANPEESKEIQQ